MPRTKRVSKPAKNKASDISSLDKVTKKQESASYLKDFDVNCAYILKRIDDECESVLTELKMITDEFKSKFQTRIGNTTLEDLPNVVSESTHFITVSETISRSNVFELSSAIRSKTKKTKRSVSVADDEGYLTSENSANSGGSCRSRSKSKQTKSGRTTRSLSRSNAQQQPAPYDNYKTPANRAPKNDYGFVTPKVKPNTPQVILRRPKEGEMAISMQGSPLMVSTIVSREANVNIPLGDGRTISIQPQHGLRMSQLPTIDGSLRRQIEVLRDNLIKVCSLNNNKK